MTSKIPWPFCLNGRDEPDPIATRYQIGDLSFEYSLGELRYVAWRGIEFARRIYAAFRDENWSTVAIQMVDEAISQTDHQIRFVYKGKCVRNPIHFEFAIEIVATAEGSLEYTFRGVSQSDFQSNRIGLCYLHPIESLANKDCSITDSDGSVHLVRFKQQVHPENPATNIVQMNISLDDSTRLDIDFFGERFEIEDQRNWIDDSFKTFCRPLSLPRPFLVQLGERLEQRIECKLTATTSEPPTANVTRFAPQPDDVHIKLSDSCETLMPRQAVGLCWNAVTDRLNLDQLHSIRDLQPDHLRVTVDLSRTDLSEQFEAATQLARDLHTQLELAISIDKQTIEKLEGKANADMWSRVFQPMPIVRCLLFSRNEWHAPDELSREVTRWIRKFYPAIDIFVGTQANFAELNRRRPSCDGLFGVCFSAQPQEHASDNSSLVETPRALGETVQTAKSFTNGKKVCVGPIAMRKQVNPYGTPPDETYSVDLPLTVDRRQRSLLGAAWTMACLKYLAENGATASSWYQLTGWKGIIAGVPESPLQDLFPAPVGTVYPIYHILADWCEYKDASTIRCFSSNRLQIEVAALATTQMTRWMIVNLQSRVQRVRLPDACRNGTIRILDESSVEIATHERVRYRQGALDRAMDSNSSTIELPPFSYTRIDACK